MIYPQATAPLAVANPLLGLGPGIGALKSTDPITLSTCVWDFRMDTAVYTDVGGTTPASAGSALKYWGNRKTGGSLTKMTEAVTNAMTLTASGADNNGSGRLEGDAAVTISGTFTAYILATWNTGLLHWCGQDGAGGGIFFFANNIYFCDAAFADVNIGVGGDTGRKLFRMRRAADNVIYYKPQGGSESIMGTKSTSITVSQMFGRKGVDVTADNNLIERNCLFSADLVATNQAAGVEQNIIGAAL